MPSPIVLSQNISPTPSFLKKYLQMPKVPTSELQTTILFRSPYLYLYCRVIKKLFLPFLRNFNLICWKKFFRHNREGLFLKTIMLIYGNLISLKNWKISSDKIVKLTFRYLTGSWFLWVQSFLGVEILLHFKLLESISVCFQAVTNVMTLLYC